MRDEYIIPLWEVVMLLGPANDPIVTISLVANCEGRPYVKTLGGVSRCPMWEFGEPHRVAGRS